jgi:hypothetical protein
MKSSLSQLRVSGGMGTKVPHPTSFEIYKERLSYSEKHVNRGRCFVLCLEAFPKLQFWKSYL